MLPPGFLLERWKDMIQRWAMDSLDISTVIVDYLFKKL
jgi:hypothetical protein